MPSRQAARSAGRPGRGCHGPAAMASTPSPGARRRVRPSAAVSRALPSSATTSVAPGCSRHIRLAWSSTACSCGATTVRGPAPAAVFVAISAPARSSRREPSLSIADRASSSTLAPWARAMLRRSPVPVRRSAAICASGACRSANQAVAPPTPATASAPRSRERRRAVVSSACRAAMAWPAPAWPPWARRPCSAAIGSCSAPATRPHAWRCCGASASQRSKAACCAASSGADSWRTFQATAVRSAASCRAASLMGRSAGSAAGRAACGAPPWPATRPAAGRCQDRSGRPAARAGRRP